MLPLWLPHFLPQHRWTRKVLPLFASNVVQRGPLTTRSSVATAATRCPRIIPPRSNAQLWKQGHNRRLVDMDNKDQGAEAKAMIHHYAPLQQTSHQKSIVCKRRIYFTRDDRTQVTHGIGLSFAAGGAGSNIVFCRCLPKAKG